MSRTKYSTWRIPGAPEVGDVVVVVQETPSDRRPWVHLLPGDYLTRVVARRSTGKAAWLVEAQLTLGGLG